MWPTAEDSTAMMLLDALVTSHPCHLVLIGFALPIGFRLLTSREPRLIFSWIAHPPTSQILCPNGFRSCHS